MNTDSPVATGSLSPRKRSQSRPSQERIIEMEEGANLFYAYALRVRDTRLIPNVRHELNMNLY